MPRTEIMGRDEILGLEEIGWNPLRSAYRGIKRGARATGRGLRRAASVVPEALSKSNFASVLQHGDVLGREEIMGRDEILGLEEIMGDDVFPDDSTDVQSPAHIQKTSAAADKYIVPAFKTKQITKADMVKYLNTLRPGDREMAARNLVNSFKYMGVTIMGDDQLGSVASSALSTTSKVAKKLVTLPIDLTERVFSATTRPLAHAFVGRDEILGSFVGDDEVCAAREGSRSDRQALRRRLPASTSGYNSHWSHVSGDAPTGEALEELKERAKAGDARAAAALAKLRRSGSSGDLQEARASGPKPALTRDERSMVNKILATKQAAEAGDVAAQRKMRELRREVPHLIEQAKSGNEKARRNLQILEDIGAFGRTLKASEA